MSKMTQPPWVYEFHKTWQHCVRAPMVRVRSISTPRGEPETTEAAFVAYRLRSKEDAILFSAAPDLLEACKALIADIHGACDLYDMDLSDIVGRYISTENYHLAVAAIAKVEGETHADQAQ